MKFFAFIPARSGSKRIKDKNMSLINGRSLIQIAVETCLETTEVSDTFIISDSSLYQEHACSYGAKTLGLRPLELSTDTATDRQWLHWAVNKIRETHPNLEDLFYIIVRPTSPFRDSNCLASAIQHFRDLKPDRTTCLRSVVKVSQHPGKMWRLISPSRMVRLLPFNQDNDESTPWSDSQYPSLPLTYAQNAAIEIGCMESIVGVQNFPISGFTTIPFIMDELQSYDINTPLDLKIAEYLSSF